MKNKARKSMFGFLRRGQEDSAAAAAVIDEAANDVVEAPVEAGDPERKQLRVSELKPGMMICGLDRSWEETPFQPPSVLLQNWEDVKSVQMLCRQVWIDSTRTVEMEEPSPGRRDFSMQGDTSGERYEVHRMDREQVRQAKRFYAQASELLDQMFDTLRDGDELDANAAREIVTGCVRSILYNPDALTWLTRLVDSHAPTAEHSLNVCILAVNFGRYLGLPRDELENLGICALLHDVGVLRVPTELLDKEDVLDNEEYQILKQHAVHGRNLLLDTPRLYVGAADVAYSHHENWDGTGYPRRLRGDQIPLFAQIVALADTYESVVTARPYQPARSPLEALRLIHSNRGVRFDPRLALRFIECIGIYPSGAVVELENDEFGVVLSATRDKLRPRIAVVRDAEGLPLVKPRVVDLSEGDADAKGQQYRVRTVLPAGSHGIDSREYLDEGLINRRRRTLARPIDIVL